MKLEIWKIGKFERLEIEIIVTLEIGNFGLPKLQTQETVLAKLETLVILACQNWEIAR